MIAQIKIRVPLAVCFGVVVAFFGILTGCGPAAKEKAREEKMAIPVRVMQVELKTMQNILDYVGNIKAEDEALVYPKVSGKVMEKLKNEGDAVAKGNVIAYIDRDEVGFKFEKAPVESPLTGIIGRVYVDLGTQLTPQTAVALVVRMDNVKIEVDIPEQYLPRIIIGQTAKVFVQAYPEETFSGTVARISPVLDIETRTAPVEIMIPNPRHTLKSGMFAQVRLVLVERRDVPVIIKEAIMGKSPGFYVYTVSGNTAHQKNISLGIHQDAYYEVTGGLQEGDAVVVVGQQRLYEGAAVNVEPENNRRSRQSQGDQPR